MFCLMKTKAIPSFLSRKTEAWVTKVTIYSVGGLEVDLSYINIQASGLTTKPHNLLF